MNKIYSAFFCVLIMVCSAVLARTGGPDAEGYRFIDSDEPGGPPFEWIDISLTGSSGPSGDDSRLTVSIPGAFEYYGNYFTQVTICTNGWIVFGSTTYTLYTVDSIPSPSYPQNVVGLCFMDLTTTYGGQIKYQTLPDGRFVVSYIDVTELGYSSNTYSMQFVLDLDRRTIQLNYLDVSPVGSSYREGSVGIENGTGLIGLFYGHHSATSSVLHDSLSILFRSTLVVNPPYFNNCYASTDFEHEGSVDDWEQGRPLSAVSPHDAHSFPFCWGTQIDTVYSPYSNSILYPPRMYIGGCGQPIFDWWQWYDTDSADDGGVVEITTDDGITWNVVEPEGGYPCAALGAGSALAGYPAFSGSSGGWEYQSIDLTPFVFAGEVRLRFHFAADASDEMGGWYIDDIGLSESFGVIWGHVDLDYRTDDTGARVEILDLGIWDISDTSGYYFLDSVKTGTWDVMCTRDSFAAQSALGISIARNDTVELNFLMPPVLMATNFDTNSAGGDPEPDDGWQWGRPDSFAAPPASAHSDSFCWGTNLQGNYMNFANWTLDFQVFLVADHPHMEIYHWYKFAGEYAGYFWDGGNVKCKAIYEDSFSIVYPRADLGYNYDGPISDHNTFLGGQPGFGGEGTGDFWHPTIFNLSDWAMDTAIIRFEIGSDGAGTSRGWYIDDLVITDYSAGIKDEILAIKPNRIGIKAYPNPFNPSTTIEFTLPNTGPTQISVYNISGQRVRVLSEKDRMRGGPYRVIWDGRDDCGAELPTGIYLAKVTAGGLSNDIRLLLVK